MRKILSVAFLSALMIGLAAAQTPAPIKQNEAGKKALAKIRQLGGLALELAQSDQHLEVSYIQTDGKFSDENLAVLKDLKGLVHLDLRGQPVADAQLVHLKPLTELTRLHLEKTKITDKGLENLKGLVNLEYLNLYGTAVSDAGLVHLQGMKKLKNLYLWQTKVTDAGAARLKKAIPGVDINLGFKEPPAVIVAKKDDKKPETKIVAKKEAKKPEAKIVAKKPGPKKQEKKTEPKTVAKKKEPAKDANAADGMAALLKARLSLAVKAYHEAFEGFGRTQRVGNVLHLVTEKPEEVYVWSVRWLHSQQDLSPRLEDQAAALEAHLRRMTELRKATEALPRDLVPSIRVDEAEWYRLEAQLWLVKFKKANPGVRVNVSVKAEPEPKVQLPAPVEGKKEKKDQKPEPKKEERKPEPKKEGKKAELAKDTKSSDGMTTLLKERAAAAEKAYRVEFAALSTQTRRFGNITLQISRPENIYTWSVRWLQAQRELSPKHEDQIAALEAHLRRMTELKKATEALPRDLIPSIRVDEAEWYRLEAQIWLAKAKAEKAKAK